MADQPPPGGTLLAMPGAQGGDQPPPGGTRLAMPGAQGGDQPPPGGTVLPMPDATPASAPPTTNFLAEQPGTVGMGALKKIRQMAAGLVDMTDAYMTGKVGPTSMVPTLPVALPEGGKVDTTLRSVSDYLRQNSTPTGAAESAGAIIPDMAAIATPELWGGEATEGMSAADKVLAMGRNLKTLEKNPGLLKILQRATTSTVAGAGKAALPAAALTNVETGGDPVATGEAALGAGVLGGLGEGIPAVAREAAAALRPTSEALEGVTMPVAASQRPNASVLTKLVSRPEDIPAVEAARQAAAPEIIQNSAQRALKNVLDDVNTTRGMMQGPAEAEGVPAGAFKFSVSPHGAPVETTDPNFVQKLLNEARDLQESDAFDTMGPRQQARVASTVDDLSQQLDQYHTELATRPHFTPIDRDAALASTSDFRTAGDIMQNSVDDIYQRMRGAANEQLDKKWLKQLSPSEFSQLMEQNADKFSPEERQVATDTFRKGAVAKMWHDALQQGFNISPEQEAATADIGGQRTFTGSNKIASSIDDVVANHGDDLRSMIGDEGINSARRLNQLMKGPDTSGPLQKLLRNTAAIMRHHYGGIAGFVGSAAAPFLGVSHLTGMAGGAATGYALQKVINNMATDPAIAGRIAYAVEHNVSSHIAAPLIAMMMTRRTPQGGP